MKVIKFGGTSVGSVESILSVKRIVERQTEPVIVVVSALGGITDKLIKTSQMAVEGDALYQMSFEEIKTRHEEMITAIIPAGERRAGLMQAVGELLEELRSIYQGVYLIRDLSPKIQAAIVSYGERISSQIVAALVDGAVWFDSRKFIKTEFKAGKHRLVKELTNKLVRETWQSIPKVSLVGGFISTDVDSGEVTNLGRGGSDYTASIIAAALDASVLEIWTDVDGFMTADPRVISSAYVIPELSYIEAMELSNFGAKVVYPPTIYPVCIKHIPILIKNTFNPDAPGSIIKDEVQDDSRSIKGISSIKGTTLITVSGLSMVGVIGVNRRIFTCLADNGISVFMVSQASSENSTSIGVRDEDADEACRVLDLEFQKEIEDGSMFPMLAEKGLATVAIVGENMKHTPGIAGKLFGTLGRSGISVIACAQGASETNISFVINQNFLRKALNVIHDSFFLSEYQVLNLFICGVGTVGGSLLEQIYHQQEKLKRELRLKLNVVGIASGHNAMFTREGINLENFREQLAAAPASNIKRLHDEVIGMNIFNSVFVDCTASPEVASLYADFLEHNINVVAANKIAASSDYDNYRLLKETSQKRGVKFLFETNVGAGLPIIRTINDLCNSGDKILRIEAVLSGTLNFIFNTISKDIPFSETVRMAKEEGYSEPDPRIDLSGKDVIRKLVILAREAGYEISQEDVEAKLFIPQSFFDGTLDEFWKNLPSLDADFEARRQELEKQKKVWRFVAKLEDGKASVSLQEFDSNHSFYVLEGSNNIVMLTTERYRKYPMLIQGYGAGASVTAAGVFADIMSLA
ncbi:MAG: bifunctional aspartate kinase/homoserine dehydrogenase I [Bacteroidaceae bacterium]|nr:bifunctional aspartate kinase/homoserine dehydrogenase I [Bacteroidaceae bacterium]MBQ9294725.1 bifunctional aspartate kinase/homoserine dehydrogenase I [Bacteroidaceae bacterium]